MKILTSLYFLIFLLLSFNSVQAQKDGFGLGLVIGEPTGLSAKLWLNNKNAVAFGLSWSNKGNRFNSFEPDYNRITRTHIHVDYLWHSFDAINARFPLFYGVGGRIDTGIEYGGTVGARGIIGIVWLPDNTPLDVFVEFVPTLLFINSTGFGVDAGIGARFFF
ncbi:MAG: hypothetical protein KJ571_03385 [Bacteroidetes bacterium]|nr:hypothetical protein [Bacteroidota bacterium]